MNHRLNVTNIQWHGSGIFELSLSRNGIDFTPGDCVALFNTTTKSSRPYSISSGTQEKNLHFIIRHIPHGDVSHYLAGLKPGDTVETSPPFGWFHPGENKAPYIFIATGAGIAPVLSQIRTHPEHPPLQLLYGVRRCEDAIAYDWLEKNCNVRLAVSREKTDHAHFGRITDLLNEIPPFPEYHYYLCGLDAMIDDVTRHLESAKVHPAHIHRECFFNSQ